MKRVVSFRSLVSFRAALVPLALASVVAAPLSAQDRPAARAELVREVLSSPDAGDAWSALESEAVEAADGPFLLLAARFDELEGSLILDLGGYGLPTLEQSMKAGARTRLVVSLPGARTGLQHGLELAAGDQFADVRVRQAPYGVEVEASLPEGVAALIDETAEGVRIRAVAEAPPTAAASPAQPFAADELAVAAQVARAWVGSLKAGRPLALFPTLGVAALMLLALGWLVARRRAPTPAWHGASDAQRLADRLISQAH